jgi:hypothetical protein
MNIIEQIKKRQDEIKIEILRVVQDQSYSLTQKNLIMQPLVDENKILGETINKLNDIKSKNYFGLCNPI